MNKCICATIVHHSQAYYTKTAREIEGIAKLSNKLNKFNRPRGRQPFRGIYRSRFRGYRGYSGRGTSRGGNMSYNSPLQGPSNYPDSKNFQKRRQFRQNNSCQYYFNKQESNIIETEIEKLTKLKVIKPVEPQSGQFLSPIFVRPKKKWRTKNDSNLKK
ncbi:hypothetical protein DPMN_067410 [Dreissena polymorpha]|uniref:Uncharacterized protein n=1 Tax=Dreissena polymorpha TaxID=45954 RepID=A0A9D4BTJ2_DREPO|nr:hypothetical protein DPMN_067410 [Dreissena polymorpha]